MFEDFFHRDEDGWIREQTNRHEAGGAVRLRRHLHPRRPPCRGARRPSRCTATRRRSGGWATTSPMNGVMRRVAMTYADELLGGGAELAAASARRRPRSLDPRNRAAPCRASPAPPAGRTRPPPRPPGRPVDERRDPAASRGAERPRARTRCIAVAFSSSGRARSIVPSRRARRPISLRRSSVASLPPPVPTITIRPLHRERGESASRFGPPTSSSTTSAPPSACARATSSPGSITVAPSAATAPRSSGGAHGREHAGAGRRRDLHGRRAHAAVRAVDDEQLAGAKAGLAS